LGSQGGNLSLWGPGRFFSVVGIAIDIPIIRKSREKSFGQRPKFGQAGGNLSLWGPERFFLVARNAKCTY